MMSIAGDRWYKAEIVPPTLAELRTKLIDHFDIPPDWIGIRGNPETHKRGFHRSRNFIVNSPLCTDRGYSVTAAVNKGGNGDWVCGLDFKLDHARLLLVCKRLDVALKSGRLEKVLEFYGNTNGDSRVDGWDNIANVLATSDSSHLWHGHLGIARSRAGEDHSDIFAVMTGQDARPPTPTQAVRKHDPDSARVVETIVPAGIADWETALHHWYWTPAEPGSRHELDHVWRFRTFNNSFNGPGQYEHIVPGRTRLLVPRTLGY